MTSPEWPDVSDAEVERRKVMRDIPGRVIRAHEMGPGFCSCGAGIGDSIDVRWHLVNQAVAATFDRLTAARSVLPEPDAVEVADQVARALLGHEGVWETVRGPGKRDREERKVRDWNGDDACMVSYTAEDGMRSTRSLTFREVVDAALARTAPPTEPAEVEELRAEVGRWRTLFGDVARGMKVIEQRDAARADLADRDKTIAGVRALRDEWDSDHIEPLHVKHRLRAILDGTAGVGRVDGL